MHYDTLLFRAHLLESHCFNFDCERQAYVSYRLRQVFSIEFVEKATAREIAALVMMNNRGWDFYFVTPPSASVRKKLLAYFKERERS